MLTISSSFCLYSETKTEIKGYVDWETMMMKAEFSLDLTSAGLKLPAGRTQAESLLKSNYLNLMRPFLLELQVDSSSTIGDLIARDEFTMIQADSIALGSNTIPSYMQPDMRKISEAHTIMLSAFSSLLISHSRPAQVIRTLTPVSSAAYTGIIIIASDEQPVHAMRGSALPVPCLFPKIWDSEMNLIYERGTVEPRNIAMVHYAPLKNIFQNNPSGLTPALQQIVGTKPMKIFARGVFGEKPTDLIIDQRDALTIISSEENRRLLAQGKVVIVLDDSALRYEFGASSSQTQLGTSVGRY